MNEECSYRPGDGWVPAELVWFRGRPAVTLFRLPDNRPREPFFHQTLERARAAEGTPRPRLVLLDDAPDAADGFEPSGFIFHMMRCGSTLVSRLLAALPGTRVLSEPFLFYALFAETAGGWVGSGSDAADRRRWLRRLLGLYARGLCGGVGATHASSLVVKWSSVIGQFIGPIEEAYPGVPKLFLTRDPVEVLVSIEEERPGGSEHTKDEQVAPHLRAGSTAALHALPPREADARHIASCCYWAGSSRRLRLLDYHRLPPAVWNELAAYFGLELGPGDVTRLEQLSRLYSKDETGQRVFAPDGEEKRARASQAVREAAARLVTPELARLRERHPALSPPTQDVSPPGRSSRSG